MVSKFERRITTQLKSWLTAVGIRFQDSTSGLVVTSKDGASIPVSVVVKGSPVAPGAIPVQAEAFTARDLKTSLSAFGSLQEALGYTPPKVPVDRGPIPSRKADFSDDFELVVMRHMDFRRSPNPTSAELKSFKLVIDKAVWWFYKKNVSMCADMGLEIEDLRSYGMQWTCNYLGLYRSELGRAEDEKNLCQFLKQRFIEFREQLDRKARNVLPMLDDAYIAMHGRPYEYTNKGEWFSTDPEADNVWEIPTAPEGDATPTKRERTKKSAVATLNARLAELPHDQLVSTLSEAVTNDRIHQDARRAASKKLQDHARKCTQCSKEEFPRAPHDGSVPNNLPIQDELGTVFGSAKEAADAHGVYPSNVRAVLSGRYRHTGGHVFSYVQPAA